MFLGKVLAEIIKEQNEGGDDQTALILHHFDDLKQALIKAKKAFNEGNVSEVLDNIVIVQNSAIDIEELITGKEPEL